MSIEDNQVMLDGCTTLLRMIFGESNWVRWNDVRQHTELTSFQSCMSWVLDLAEQELLNNANSEPTSHYTVTTDGDMEYGSSNLGPSSFPPPPGNNESNDEVVLVESGDAGMSEEMMMKVVGDGSGAPPVQMSFIPEKQTFFCECCSVSLSDIEVVKEHMRLRHMGEAILILCQCCNQSFSTIHHYVTYHKANAALKGSSNLVCDYCAKAFKAKTDLESHVANKHLKMGPRYECQACGKRFSYVQSLNKHRKTCNNMLSSSSLAAVVMATDTSTFPTNQ